MHPYKRSATVVYLILVMLTLVTWAIGRRDEPGLELSLLVLAFAMLKGQMVGDFFMGLKQSGGIWRWVIFIWLFIPGALISIAFITASGG